MVHVDPIAEEYRASDHQGLGWVNPRPCGAQGRLCGWRQPCRLQRMELPQALQTLFNPFAPERADPYPLYEVIREHAPVVVTPFGALITRYGTVESVLRSAAFRTPLGFREADDPAGPPSYDPNRKLTLHRRHWVLFQSGEPHARLRRLMTKVFTPRAVRALGARIDQVVQELLAPALARGAMEVVADLAYPLPATVICEMLGLPEADREQNRAWATAVAATVEPVCSDEQRAAAEQAMDEWDGYVRALMAERRRSPQTALLDAMLTVEDEGRRLTDDEVAANLTFLFIAGHETTTNLISGGLLALLRNPEQLEILRRDPGLLDNGVEELLRYDAPVQLAARVARERTEVEGVGIEPGIIVSVALGMANRDPRRFEQPQALDVLRKDPRPLSFGGGAHYCIGAALARLETAAALRHLLGATASLELADETPRYRPALTLRALEALPIALRTA